MKPDTAVVEQAQETAQELVKRASEAVVDKNWVIGECAAKWCRWYARGQSDADFAELINCSRQLVNECRNVHESLGKLKCATKWQIDLRWKHFVEMAKWDDAADMLEWALATQANWREIQAYHRTLHGLPESDSATRNSTITADISNHQQSACEYSDSSDTEHTERDTENTEQKWDAIPHSVPQAEPQEARDSPDQQPSTVDGPAVEPGPPASAPVTSEEFLDRLVAEIRREAENATVATRRAVARDLRKLADSLDPPSTKFIPPTIGEVRDYCDRRGNGVDPETFVAHYEASGWMRGKNRIRDWRACVRTWEGRQHAGNNGQTDLDRVKQAFRDAAATTIVPRDD